MTIQIDQQEELFQFEKQVVATAVDVHHAHHP
jgi:hypothetical protein